MRSKPVCSQGAIKPSPQYSIFAHLARTDARFTGDTFFPSGGRVHTIGDVAHFNRCGNNCYIQGGVFQNSFCWFGFIVRNRARCRFLKRRGCSGEQSECGTESRHPIIAKTGGNVDRFFLIWVWVGRLGDVSRGQHKNALREGLCVT